MNNFKIKSLTLALLMLGILPALAGEKDAVIYKCSKPDGAIFYNDKPCSVDDNEKTLKRLQDPNQVKATSLGDVNPIIEKLKRNPLTPVQTTQREAAEDDSEGNATVISELNGGVGGSSTTDGSSSPSTGGVGAETDNFLSQDAKELSKLEFNIPMF